MTREEYKEKRKSLEAQLNQLEIDYISSNSPIKIGTKVTILSIPVSYGSESKEDIGIVTGYQRNYHDEVIPVFSQLKKDGTASSRELRVYGKILSITPIN